MEFIVLFVSILCDVLIFAIFARVILSWFSVDPSNSFVNILHQITDPILEPLRKIIPPLGMFDISPIAAIILLQILSALFRSAA